mgnify:CR=1 FL=1
MSDLVTIFTEIILPIFVLVAGGALLEKRFKLDITTLSRLSFYVFVPALLFKALVESTLQFDKLAVVAGFQTALITAMFLTGMVTGKVMRLGERAYPAFLLAAVFCNSANFGIPLVQLAFPDNPSTATGYQAINIMIQNLSTFTLGLVIVNHGRARIGESLKHTLRFPFIYVIVGALVLKYLDWHTVVMNWPWFWNPIKYAGNGLVAMALLTLGVQIAKTPRIRRLGALVMANFLRLAIAPAIAYLLVRVLEMLGLVTAGTMLAQLLVISAAGPSAVNTVLISLEFDSEPEFAASAVFYSTLFSALTVAVTIFLVRRYV